MPLTLPEARTRSGLVHDVVADIHLDLTEPDRYLVEATLSFGCRSVGSSTFLELVGARDLQVSTAEGVGHDYDGERITLTGLAEHNEVTLVARMPYVTDGDGMTAVTDPADGERYVCSYTAMDIAHRVIPCFDQPDLKTIFKVSVSGPAHWTVLANGPALDHDGTRRNFGATPPISSYLFFVAAGPWTSFTWDEPYSGAPGGSLPFGWHARASQADALAREAVWLRDLTSKAFAHYTSIFDEPYAFADYQQVFSPGLNWGAMEFPGCVAFRDEYLTPGEPTAIQRQALASVVCHEMAHMWFGDLVTMRWWEDSWLNESFADFMGYEVSARIGESDGWTNAALTRKPTAYAADSRRSTHPIAEDAENLIDADTAFANFDMITYAKGNAVLRQLVTWLGEEDFLRGVNAHLSAHPFGNATLADFLDALASSTDRDVRTWAETWLRSTGFDTIRLRPDADGVPTLTRLGSRPHRFVLTVFDDEMRVHDTRLVDLGAEPLRLPEFADYTVLPNSADETYAALDLDPVTWQALRSGLAAIGSPLSRAVVWQTAQARVGAGLDSVDELVGFAAVALPEEPEPVIFEGALALVSSMIRSHATPATVDPLLERLAELARRVLAGGPPSHHAAAGRLLTRTGSDAALLRTWLDGDAGLVHTDQELRWAVVTRLAELGHPEMVDVESARDPSNAGRQAALRSRAAVPTAAAKEWAWQRLVSGELSNREFAAVVSGFWGLQQGRLVADWVRRAPAELAAVARASGQAMGQLTGRALPMLPLDTAALEDLAVAINEALHGAVPTVAARQFNDHLDDIRSVLAARRS